MLWRGIMILLFLTTVGSAFGQPMVEIFPAEIESSHVAVRAGGERIFVTDQRGAGRITAFESTTGANLAQGMMPGGEGHRGVAVASELNLVLVAVLGLRPDPTDALQDGGLALFDAESLRLVDFVPTQVNAYDVAVSPDESYAYLSHDAHELMVIDLGSLDVVGGAPVGNGSRGVAVYPDGGLVLVANSISNDVAFVDVSDPTSPTLIASVPVGSSPSRVAVSPDGTHAFATNRDDNDLSVIDIRAMSEIARVSVGGGPQGVVIHPSAPLVYVANSISNDVTLLDVSSPSAPMVLTTVPLGGPTLPDGVAVAPDGNAIYVTTYCINEPECRTGAYVVIPPE